MKNEQKKIITEERGGVKMTTKTKPVITSEMIQKNTEKLEKSRKELSEKIAKSPGKKLKEYKPSPVLNGLMKQAFSELKKVEGSYLKIAFAIYRIHADQLYTELGCKDIYTFTRDNFGLSRGTCHNFITIVDRFGKRDDKGVLLNELIDDVKGYKSTQLVIMSGMDANQLAQCKPEMTCAQLKSLTKNVDAIELSVPESSCNLKGGKDSVSVNDDDIIDCATISRQQLITCISLDDYISKADKIDDMIRRVFKNERRNIKIEISYTWDD